MRSVRSLHYSLSSSLCVPASQWEDSKYVSKLDVLAVLSGLSSLTQWHGLTCLLAMIPHALCPLASRAVTRSLVTSRKLRFSCNVIKQSLGRLAREAGWSTCRYRRVLALENTHSVDNHNQALLLHSLAQSVPNCFKGPVAPSMLWTSCVRTSTSGKNGQGRAQLVSGTLHFLAMPQTGLVLSQCWVMLLVDGSANTIGQCIQNQIYSLWR